MSYDINSKFIKLATGEYPRYEGDVRRDHPEIPEEATWPNFPCPDTYAVVPWEAPPSHDAATHCAAEGQPLLVNGQWKINWIIRPYTQEELDSLAKIAKEEEEAAAASLARINALKETATSEGDSSTPEIIVQDFDLVIDKTPINP